MIAEALQTLRSEMESGIRLAKCQKCGCMREALDQLALLATLQTEPEQALYRDTKTWNQQMRPVEYACLGCQHCYAAVALNAMSAAFPSVTLAPLACDFQVLGTNWPAVAGEYQVVDPHGHIAVSTLATTSLTAELAKRKPTGLAIVGKTETENIGIDKIVKNVITNPTIQFLVVAGADPAGHWSGQTLVALAANGIDAAGRVIGSLGKRPILRNVGASEVKAFRDQVQVINLIGRENADEIITRMETLAPHPTALTAETAPCG